MKLEEIKKKISEEQYSFLKEDPHLNQNICLLTLGGSHAYGMDTDTSDLDLRGCTLNSKKEILRGTYYEQFINTDTDTVIYSFNKLINLLTACNPNVIEMLGCKREHYLYLSEAGKELLNNKELFLSKRCVTSFGGYANQQLRRLQNALARDSYTKEEREKHILNTLRNMKYHLKEKYPGYDDRFLKLYIDKSEKEDMDTEIYMDFNLKKFPLRDYRGIMSEMNTVINEYSKLGKRNTKKDYGHLAKHMAHLLRLYMMSLDILNNHEIITYRENEHKLLMDVRNGEYLQKANDERISIILKEAEDMRKRVVSQYYADLLEYEMAKAATERSIDKMMTGIYEVKDEFWEILNQYEKKFEEAKAHSTLPDEPDYEKIMDLKEKINLIAFEMS